MASWLRRLFSKPSPNVPTPAPPRLTWLQTAFQGDPVQHAERALWAALDAGDGAALERVLSGPMGAVAYPPDDKGTWSRIPANLASARRLDRVLHEFWVSTLHEACRMDRPDLVRMLLAHGANPEVGQNPLAGVRGEGAAAKESACLLLEACPGLARQLLGTIRFDEFPSCSGLECLKPPVRAAAQAFLDAQALAHDLPPEQRSVAPQRLRL